MFVSDDDPDTEGWSPRQRKSGLNNPRNMYRLKDNRLEKAWGSRRVEAALAAMFTLDGVPMLYNGQEVADAARHSIFGRLPVDWANGETPAGQTRRAFCQRLCMLRHAEPALTRGAVVWLDNDQPDSVLSFLRRVSGEEILAVVNLSARPTGVRIRCSESPPWSPDPLIAEGARAEADARGPTVQLEGFGYLVTKRK